MPSLHTMDLPQTPVLVTGATGFIASWLVKRLVEKGLTVHAAVRNPEDEEKTAHLKRLSEEFPDQIHFFKSNLLDEGSYQKAMEGCEVVFHTASPFTFAFQDPQRDLVEPALKGTQNVLHSANASTRVKRVVLTSSCAAIYGDNQDIRQAPQGILTENIWNTTSRLDHQPYSYSKVEAEKAAWDIANQQNRWKLVVINPSFVIGPGVGQKNISESFSIIKQMADGSLKTGAPPLEIGAVDVRDVAEAHMRAAFIKSAEGRYITSHRTLSFIEISKILQTQFGNQYPFPKKVLPKWMIWLLGPLVHKAFSREVISKNMNWPWKADHSKSQKELGLEYHSLEEALTDMFQYMIDHKLLQ